MFHLEISSAHSAPWFYRFTDDVDMDVVALYNVDATANLNSYFNCSQTALTCELPLFDSANRISEAYTSSVSWEYGTQNFELRCFSKHNLKLLALRSIIAWPLLMSLVVLFSSVIVYLVLKRMQAIEKDVSLMERMNVDLKAAKVAAEAADKAKSSFLATVSHEIRYDRLIVVFSCNPFLRLTAALVPVVWFWFNLD